MSGQLSVVLIEPHATEQNTLAERLVLADARVTTATDFQPGSGKKTDILIFRLNDIGQDLAQTLRNWQRASLGTRLLAMLGADEAESIPSLFQNGVVAFLDAEIGVNELKASFKTVQADGIYFSKVLAEALFLNSCQTAAALGLTPREQEIMRFLAVNMSNKDIARKLDLSVRTVETHRMNIRKKTGAGNRRSLATLAGQLGLMGEEYGFRKPLARRTAVPGFHED